MRVKTPFIINHCDESQKTHLDCQKKKKKKDCLTCFENSLTTLACLHISQKLSQVLTREISPKSLEKT